MGCVHVSVAARDNEGEHGQTAVPDRHFDERHSPTYRGSAPRCRRGPQSRRDRGPGLHGPQSTCCKARRPHGPTGPAGPCPCTPVSTRPLCLWSVGGRLRRAWPPEERERGRRAMIAQHQREATTHRDRGCECRQRSPCWPCRRGQEPSGPRRRWHGRAWAEARRRWWPARTRCSWLSRAQAVNTRAHCAVATHAPAPFPPISRLSTATNPFQKRGGPCLWSGTCLGREGNGA